MEKPGRPAALPRPPTKSPGPAPPKSRESSLTNKGRRIQAEPRGTPPRPREQPGGRTSRSQSEANRPPSSARRAPYANGRPLLQVQLLKRMEAGVVPAVGGWTQLQASPDNAHGPRLREAGLAAVLILITSALGGPSGSDQAEFGEDLVHRRDRGRGLGRNARVVVRVGPHHEVAALPHTHVCSGG